MTLRVAESFNSQGKRLPNKDQVESAKADLRARILELEREKISETNSANKESLPDTSSKDT